MSKAVVVLSGGQDSTTALYVAKDEGYDEIHAVTFDYGQRHRREIQSAERIAQYAGVTSHEVIRMPNVLKGTSPLVSDEELEQYEGHDKLPGGLEKTFVPMRNQLFLTIAANRAYVNGAHILYTGVSAEDYGGYPDCRPAFIYGMEDVSSLGTFTGEESTLPKLVIHTPLMFMSKKQSVEFAMQYGQCYGALALTHTAYDGAYPPVGKDHATLLRAKGFEEAGIPDPLILRAWIEGALDNLPDTDNYHTEDLDTYLYRVENVVDWLRGRDV